MRLAKKVALITGAGGGIGRAIARAFAGEGAQIVIAGRNKERLDLVAREIAADCLPIAADVSNLREIESLVESATSHFRRLDVLVNNAAVLYAGTAESQTEAEWDETFHTNVRGVWLLSRAVLPHLRKAGGGSIINLGSTLSVVGARNRISYSASKGAVLLLTRSMALDHASEKIRVNCICPGVVETEMVAQFSADPVERQKRIALHPLGRFGQPEDIAKAAVFLASDESSWITGAAFPVDGGYTAA
jgi:NAD(P)-dependent dehydrogenase (short-subunit alcohol dehydrogenase family)